MISKNKFNTLKQLENKKNRSQSGLFVAEGFKTVGDLMLCMTPTCVVAVQGWLDKNVRDIPVGTEIIEVTDDELRRLSFLQHPQEVFAVFPQPEANISVSDAEHELVLALDGIQDPGNLGTIVRIADWFGITKIFCNIGTADIYNPKAVQATMGSLAHVQLKYIDLVHELCVVRSAYESQDTPFPIYGTLLKGNSIYNQPLTPNGMIIMGNEGNGISPSVCSLITSALRIPSFFEGRTGAESLNVATATAITCSEFRRRYNM